MMVAKVLLLSAFGFIAVLAVTEGHRLGCSSDQFRCLNGKCVKRSWFCDKADDCGDNSDERYCNIDARRTSCPTEETRWLVCANYSRCLPGVWKCDGIKDCPDGSDEINCAAIRTLVQRVLSRRSVRSINKWGPHLPRRAVALYLTDFNFFAPGNATGDEIAYELSIQLMSKLSMKKKVSTEELSLFINALTVACINPKDFFGVDLVAELRSRVNRGNHTNPFTFLTLCNAGDTMTPTDVLKVKSTFHSRLRPLWTDTQALATMAMACMSSSSTANVDADILNEMTEHLKSKQHRNGTIDNAKTTALVGQALIATNSYWDNFDLGGAVQFVLRELSSLDFQDSYFILPLLNSQSLVDISSDHCAQPVLTELEILKNLRESQDLRIQARVSAFVGDEMDFVRSWQLKVPAGYNFYQVIESIGALEPFYKVHYSTAEDKKPYVVKFSGLFDDAEDEMFWFTYTQSLRNNTEPILVEKSPVDIPVDEDEELILWYRSAVWADPR